MCNILRVNFLHNEQTIMRYREVLKSHATKMPSIKPQRIEKLFPAPEEAW